MPLYDFTCQSCGHVETVLVPQKEAGKVNEKPCEKCAEKATRNFPLPARPRVTWDKPQFSFKHGKAFHSSKEVDAAEKNLREPNIEEYAKKYLQEEVRLKRRLGEEQYEEYKDASIG